MPRAAAAAAMSSRSTPRRAVRASCTAAALAALGACPEGPVAPRDASRARESVRTESPPINIGQGDQPQQVRLPVAAQPPRPTAAGAAPGEVAAYTPLPGARAGGLLVWAMPEPSGRATQVAMRAVGPSGALGPALFVASARGAVRRLDAAARADDALVVWSAEINPGWAQVAVQRVRHDGARLGAVHALGLYRIVPGGEDGGGAPDDALGHVARALATGATYTLAVRGPAMQRPSPAVSVRFVGFTDDSEPVGATAVEHGALRAPLVFLPTPGSPTAWSAAVTLGGGNAPPAVRGVGSGPLAELVVPRGTALATAWIAPSDARAHAVVVRAVPAPARGNNGAQSAEAFELVPPPGAAARDAGGPASGESAARVERMRLACAGGVAVAELTTRAGVETVPLTAPGGDALAAFVLAHPTPAAASRARRGPDAGAPPAPPAPTLAAWTGDGLLVLLPGRAEFARCDGDALGAPAALPWSTPSPPAAAP